MDIRSEEMFATATATSRLVVFAVLYQGSVACLPQMENYTLTGGGGELGTCIQPMKSDFNIKTHQDVDVMVFSAAFFNSCCVVKCAVTVNSPLSGKSNCVTNL
jgi:hypothetical protein